MTKQQQNRILEIIDLYNTLIGVEKRDIEQLKKQVRIIKTVNKDASVEEKVVDEIKYWSTILEYKINRETNLDRNQTLVAKRDVIVFKVMEKFSYYSPLEYIFADVFDKDRTSMLAAMKRCKERLETSDPLFMATFMKTFQTAA